MKSVVFVAPMFRESTMKFARAFVRLPGVQVGIISQEPLDACDNETRRLLAAHYQIRDTMDPQELVRGCRGIAPMLDGRIDRLNGHLEQLQEPLGEARDALGIEGMGAAASKNFRDKARMKEVLRRSGVPVARHKLLQSDRDLWAFVAEVGYPVIVKPQAGLGSKATFRVADARELEEALKQIKPRPDAPWQAEEFVTGAENTCETVSIRGEAVWRSGTHYIPGPLEVLEKPWLQYCVFLPREPNDPDFTSFHPINTASLKALGMGTGMSHMEWFRRKDGAAIVSEVGARPPGAGIMPLMSEAHQCDMWAKWAELMTFDTWTPPVRRFATGVAFFRGQGNGRVSKIRGLEEAQREVGEHVVDRVLPKVGQPKSESYEGEGWAMVRHPDDKVVLNALKRMIELVKIEYA